MLGVHQAGVSAHLSIYTDGERGYAIKSGGILEHSLRRHKTWLKLLLDGKEFVNYTGKNEGQTEFLKAIRES